MQKDHLTYNSYRKRAKGKFENEEMISKTKFDSIVQNGCHYCGKTGPNGIDRVDNTKGYVESNCVPCCKHCNYVKGNLSVADFKIWKDRFVTNQSS